LAKFSSATLHQLQHPPSFRYDRQLDSHHREYRSEPKLWNLPLKKNPSARVGHSPVAGGLRGDSKSSSYPLSIYLLPIQSTLSRTVPPIFLRYKKERGKNALDF
jgi:hypothetical protein